MDGAFEPETMLAAVDRAVETLCKGGLDLRDADPLLLDLTRIESDVETWKSTVEVLMKHLRAA